MNCTMMHGSTNIKNINSSICNNYPNICITAGGRVSQADVIKMEPHLILCVFRVNSAGPGYQPVKGCCASLLVKLCAP